MKPKTEQKNVCARLSRESRDKLERILEVNRRKFKGQLEAWIDEEFRIIARGSR